MNQIESTTTKITFMTNFGIKKKKKTKKEKEIGAKLKTEDAFIKLKMLAFFLNFRQTKLFFDNFILRKTTPILS